ncbi:MAG: DUF1918 domain-containing protein [Pseudonocardiaceae bacterium]
MRASKGNWLVVESVKVGGDRQEGKIIDVPHADGSPPYLVRWLDGHEALVFPWARQPDSGSPAT